jgi:hypothetical protein
MVIVAEKKSSPPHALEKEVSGGTGQPVDSHRKTRHRIRAWEIIRHEHANR